ncbi:DNA cytosine methyltransferase [Streptomyces sp. NPDC088925]|uniref:DNA cytosine methyltransferase n=1 Tax=Streptomyces sp. NPDC088925 TaxID=3365914 RepID=UPI00382BF6A2
MFTITDFFCGAGGSSQGLHRVPGLEVVIAANHWDLAVQSHALNFPGCEHDCADISQIDFRRYPRTDFHWGSPECTNHTVARGVRMDADRQPDLFGELLPTEAAVRSRATMWDIPRYLEAMWMRGKPTLGGVVENVIDVTRWIFFPSWTQALSALGYRWRVVFLNSMFAQPRFGSQRAPQSRDRAYVVYWLESLGREPQWEKWLSPPALCPEHGTVAARQVFNNGVEWGRYRAQYRYVCPITGCGATVYPPALPAAAAIRWDRPGMRIGDRKRPLAAKTLARVESGLRRYGGRPIAVPMEGRDGKSPWGLDDEPLRTQTTRQDLALAHLPDGFRSEFLPFIAEMRGGGSEKKARGVDEAMCTVTASGNHHALVTAPPLLVPVGGTWRETAAPVTQPMGARTTRETDALLVPYYGTGRARPAGQPLGTLTTKDRYALVTGHDSVPIPAVDDCYLRMLDPDEIGTGMAFETEYRLLGNRRERVRQLGNAVTPPAAEILGCLLVETVTGEDLFSLAS